MINTKYIATLTYILCSLGVVYTSYAFFNQYYFIGLVLSAITGVFFLGFWFNIKGNINANLLALYIPCALGMFLLDNGIKQNSGFFLLYIPFLISAFLIFGSKNPILKYAIIGCLILMFFLVNFTNLSPKYIDILQTNNADYFILYLNVFASLALVINITQNFENYKDNKLKEILLSQANFKALIENTPDHIWAIDKNYNLISFNQSYLLASKQFLGFYAEIGKPELSLNQNNSILQDRKKLYDKALLGNRFKEVIELNFNNELYFYELSFNPIINNDIVEGVVINATNITVKKQSESFERQAHKNLELLVSSTEDVILELDENDNCIKIWNADSNKLIYPKDYYKNKHVSEIFDQPFKINLSNLVKNVKQTGIVESLEYSFKLNGQLKHYLAKVRPIKDYQPPRVSVTIEDITQFKQNLIEQNKQKDFLDNLIANLPVGIFSKDVKNNGVYKIWNKELEVLFGLKQEDVLGRTDYEVFTNLNQIEAYAQTDEMVIESKEPLLISKLNITTSSGLIIARTIKIPIVNSNNEVENIIGIVENITEITQAQDELAAAESRWNYALTGSRDAVWDVNLETDEVYFSPIFKQLLGYSKIEKPNLVLENLIYKDDLDYVNQMYYGHIAGKFEFYEAEYRIRKKDGSYLWVLDRGKISSYDDKGKPTRIIGTFADITYKKQLEEQLIAAKNKAEDASRAKSLFLSTMSHEIRTPMNAVAGIINLLITDNPKPEHNEHLQSLKFSSDNLMHLLNDILDFSKIDAGKLELEEVEFSLQLLAKNLLHTFKVKAIEKQIELNINIDKEIPNFLIGDPVRLSQILSNLLSNAVKFTSNGNVLLEILFRNKINNQVYIEFAVSDTGIGIEPSKLETIFDAFSQAELDTTRNFGGTGLGLAISKKLTDIFGSKLYINSNVGIGTKFWFTLKLTYVDKPSEKVAFGSNQEVANDIVGMRILVAEDNKLNLFVITKFLTKWGVVFDVAENGKQTIALFSKSKYDLILMDLQMPEMDGAEATKIIRLTNKHTPIFALTATALSDVKSEVLDLGMNDFISKPFNPIELYKKLAKVYLAEPKKPTNLNLFS